MANENFLTILQRLLLNQQPVKIIVSNTRKKTECTKKILTVKIEKNLFWQEECFRGKQVFHRNFTQPEEVLIWWKECSDNYKQAQVQTPTQEYHVLFQSDGKNRYTSREIERPMEAQAHNRKKRYLMEEGQPIDFLIELGIMTAHGKVVKNKYDKFRQINRYLEIIADCLPYLSEDSLRIVDFGSGKSYLTFALYWYLRQTERKFEIIGLDINSELVDHCNQLAEKLEYTGLHFQLGDIASWQNKEAIDLVVSLHACDTATDAALAQAIHWEAKVILAVPCCQHEIAPNLSDANQEALLRHGILRERLASLVTDALRAETLEAHGYQTQVMEFIDFEHTPKNLMIKAVKQQKKTNPTNAKERVSQLLQRYGLKSWAMLKFLEKDNKSGWLSL